MQLIPRQSENTSESINGVLENCFESYVNHPALADGLHNFKSDRRDKYSLLYRIVITTSNKSVK